MIITIMSDQTIANNSSLPPILYTEDDIVIIRANGVLKKRHIYGDKPILQTWDLGPNEVPDWLYKVDYGLGLASEGFVPQSSIICVATDAHKNIPL